jgi:hypothetical protein
VSAAVTGGGDAVWVDPVVGELTVGQLAEQAAQAVRALNHLTRPGLGALSGPAEVCHLVAALACTTNRLPQLLDQLSGWLLGEKQADRLRVDACSPWPDPAATVTDASAALAQARQCVHRAGHALDAAHQSGPTARCRSGSPTTAAGVPCRGPVPGWRDLTTGWRRSAARCRCTAPSGRARWSRRCCRASRDRRGLEAVPGRPRPAAGRRRPPCRRQGRRRGGAGGGGVQRRPGFRRHRHPHAAGPH